MAKSTKVMSLSVKPEHHQLFKERAAKLKTTLSEIGRRLVEDFVELSPEIHRKLKVTAESRGINVAKLVEQIAIFAELQFDTIEKAKAIGDKIGQNFDKTVASVIDFAEITPEMQKKLRSCAEKRGVSVGRFAEQILERFPIADDTVKPILLKIPLTVLGNKDTLNKWLQDKTAMLIAHLYP